MTAQKAAHKAPYPHQEPHQKRMSRATSIFIQKFCVRLIAVLIVGSLAFNYFYSYKYANDFNLQWRVYMYCTSISLFLFSIYMWINETLKKNRYATIICGWLSFWIFFNVIGVFAGYNLHSNGFVTLLLVTAFLGLCHLILRLCQN